MSSAKKAKAPAAAGKGKKAGGAAAESTPEDQRERVLQAVVLADSYQERFMPFTAEKPRCLLPLANVPLIEYTLEFLDMNNVKEVYLYAGAHADQVEAYLQSSRWWPSKLRATSPFAVLQVMHLTDANSVGDCLRHLHNQTVVEGDFILVHGDIVSNISLESALAGHKARRKANAENIMTCVLVSGGVEAHRTKVKAITPVFVVDAKTQRCLQYDEMHALQDDHNMLLDAAIVEELSTDFEVRADFIDPGIDICHVGVLGLWADSFDYQLPRRHFLHGVLKDWELNNKAIYVEEVVGQYAARASNLQMYESISRDVLGRWTRPFVPDCNITPGSTYRLDPRTWASVERGVDVGVGAKLRSCVVGADTDICDESTITNSVIGRNCKIGKNVTITDSYVWEGSVIADGSTVQRSILAGATVGKNCTVTAGCLLSFGVQISDNITLTDGTVLSLVRPDGLALESDPTIVGPDGKGGAFINADDENLDESDPARLQKTLIYSLDHLNLSSWSISTLHSDTDSQASFPSRPVSTEPSTRSRLSSFMSDDSTTTPASPRNSAFHTEAVHGLLDSLREDDGGDFDSAKLEFMGLRLANNALDADTRRAVATAFARRAAELLTDAEYGGPLEPSKAAEVALTRRPGASDFVSEMGVGGNRELKDQIEFAVALQKALAKIKGLEAAKAGSLLTAMLQQLYNLEVLDEDSIMGWWADERAADGETMVAIRGRCKALVEWLENASEEEDDDDEDDEDDD